MKNTQLVKWLVFKVGSLNLALPVEYVIKIVGYMIVYSSGLNHIGLVNIGDREITVTNLYKRLFKTNEVTKDGQPGYLILTKNTIGEEFAIWIRETPSLMNVALSDIRTLPESYRRADTLEIATHVTLIHESTQQTMIFLLDVDQLVPPITQSMITQAI